jgi:hypothetical protein
LRWAIQRADQPFSALVLQPWNTPLSKQMHTLRGREKV